MAVDGDAGAASADADPRTTTGPKRWAQGISSRREMAADQACHLKHGHLIFSHNCLQCSVAQDVSLVRRILEVARLDVFPELLDGLGARQGLGPNDGCESGAGPQSGHESSGLLRGRCGQGVAFLRLRRTRRIPTPEPRHQTAPTKLLTALVRARPQGERGTSGSLERLRASGEHRTSAQSHLCAVALTAWPAPRDSIRSVAQRLARRNRCEGRLAAGCKALLS